MDFNTTLPTNGNVGFQPPVSFKSRTKSMIPHSNISASTHSIKTIKPDGLSVMSKLKKIFSSRNGVTTNNGNNNVEYVSNQNSRNMNIPQVIDKAQLQGNISTFTEEQVLSQYATNSIKGQSSNIEWQPVYHETCKIKLPVESSVAKIAIPQETLNQWTNDQAQIAQGGVGNYASLSKNKTILKENESENNLQTNCLINNPISQNSCTSASNKEEPYSKFKYYYNYYLVDDYLDSLTQSQNKKIDATGLNENGELYENVSLSVKPILKTKERLESGVPYDPKVVIN